MTTTSTQCFNQNATAIDPRKDPIQHNLHNGLLDLSLQVERLGQMLEQILNEQARQATLLAQRR